ncbi:hypothetical protein J2129_000722 [Methanofollis sp. W23]|uniref:alpha/beta hydrolase n=1 Tax=Methanofollis sp. W23 TaxID=2817849 RepID=UPI001DDB3D35|nr:alpha/beta hydrolase [Methanofollis sp. W23]MBP2145268.1 hypothetical protein [Methanofollis sp. W23]
MGDLTGGNLALTTMVRAYEENLLSPAVAHRWERQPVHQPNDGLDPFLSRETLLTGFTLYANFSVDNPPHRHRHP